MKQMASSLIFPDGLENKGHPKPWSNTHERPMSNFYSEKSHWYSTWKGDDAAMVIDRVRMWQLV